MSNQTATRQLVLRKDVICPHCWLVFPPEESLWIAGNPELRGDDRVGDDELRRFLPDRFTAQADAIDPSGTVSKSLACPNCHLSIPRVLVELRPTFLSIVGSPSCGKSYFLTAMTHQLRKRLPHFGFAFSDSDPVSNQILNDYEELQFHNENVEQLVKLDKTDEFGDLYSEVQLDGGRTQLQRPFMFTLRLSKDHPNFAMQRQIASVICLYDNAGESFLPGKDTETNQVTRHLARSDAILFLYDPTQTLAFRKACAGSSDPQIADAPVTSRQETVLHEMAGRVRQHTGLDQDSTHNRPLIVLVTKWDSWSTLLAEELSPSPWAQPADSPLQGLDQERVLKVSKAVRALLWEHTPELVSSAESFASEVYYIPVSATGRAPERLETGAGFGIRPADIEPVWVEVPLLLYLCKHQRGMVHQIRAAAK